MDMLHPAQVRPRVAAMKDDNFVASQSVNDSATDEPRPGENENPHAPSLASCSPFAHDVPEPTSADPGLAQGFLLAIAALHGYRGRYCRNADSGSRAATRTHRSGRTAAGSL